MMIYLIFDRRLRFKKSKFSENLRNIIDTIFTNINRFKYLFLWINFYAKKKKWVCIPFTEERTVSNGFLKKESR